MGIGLKHSDFYKNGKYTGNPFQRSIRCLKDERSVGAKTGDAACFRKRRKKESRLGARDFKQVARRIEDNSDVEVEIPYWIELGKCQIDQTNEAFADWLCDGGLCP